MLCLFLQQYKRLPIPAPTRNLRAGSLVHERHQPVPGLLVSAAACRSRQPHHQHRQSGSLLQLLSCCPVDPVLRMPCGACRTHALWSLSYAWGGEKGIPPSPRLLHAARCGHAHLTPVPPLATTWACMPQLHQHIHYVKPWARHCLDGPYRCSGSIALLGDVPAGIRVQACCCYCCRTYRSHYPTTLPPQRNVWLMAG